MPGGQLESTYLATFRAILRKYPEEKPAKVLRDLVARTPGDEGKWFAAANRQAFTRRRSTLPIEPMRSRTLTRLPGIWRKGASVCGRGRNSGTPVAGEGLWLRHNSLDVRAAYDNTMAAAENAGCRPEAFDASAVWWRQKPSVNASSPKSWDSILG